MVMDFFRYCFLNLTLVWRFSFLGFQSLEKLDKIMFRYGRYSQENSSIFLKFCYVISGQQIG